MLREFLPIKTTAEIGVGYLVLSPTNSVCQIDETTKSRFNVAHVDFVMDLIVRNYQGSGYRGQDITVMSPYKD
jgi:hypothetical protein